MPVPSPRSGEDQKKFIARCMRMMHEQDKDRPQKQQLAICFDVWRDHQKEKVDDWVSGYFDQLRKVVG